MNNTISNLIVLVLMIAALVFILKAMINKKFIVRKFKEGNTITFGTKGKGKDFLFQAVINERREGYKSILDYGGKYKPIQLSELSVAPNTYEDMINGTITYLMKPFDEREDVYLPDGGLYLPSQYDTYLDKKYPSFPITYATSRHLGRFNIHINVQYIGRIWKKIREQADFYFKATGIVFLPFGWAICNVRYYEKYEAAERGIKPLKERFMNKYSQAEKDEFDAQNGIIKDLYYIVNTANVHYNTRHFATVFYPKTIWSKDVRKCAARIEKYRSKFPLKVN